MAVVNVLVEGKDDLIFVRRLIDVMRIAAGLVPLKWSLVNQNEKVTLKTCQGEMEFGNCVVQNGGDVIGITETRGVYGCKKNASVPNFNPAVTTLKLGGKTYKVGQFLGIFDADAPMNFLGNPVPYGGFTARKAYLNGMLSRLSGKHSLFLLKDNGSDTCLEELAVDILAAPYNHILPKHWPSYRASLKADFMANHVSYLDYSRKCEIAQLATAIDQEVAKDLYWLAALWNLNMWDWNATALTPLKAYLKSNIPALFV